MVLAQGQKLPRQGDRGKFIHAQFSQTIPGRPSHEPKRSTPSVSSR
jgi:hypothetical protein